MYGGLNIYTYLLDLLNGPGKIYWKITHLLPLEKELLGVRDQRKTFHFVER